MRLYDNKRAPNTRRVRIFLAEKEIEIECIDVDIMVLEHKSADFEAKNPFTRVPVLELDDGTHLSESIAICRYFEALQPQPAMFGETALEKATIEMWNRRVEWGLVDHIRHGLRHTNKAMAPLEVPQVPEWGRVSQEKIDPELEIMNHGLSTTPYIAGEAFSVADITLLVGVDFLRVLKRTIPEEMTHLKRWYDDVSARSSASA